MSENPQSQAPCLEEAVRAVERVDGWLSEREVRFLALLGACPTAVGDILEIGCYRGKSTIALALGARQAGAGRVITVDPLPNDGPTAPDEQGRHSARALLDANLRRAGVAGLVEIHQLYSDDFAQAWTPRKLRLFWHDGGEQFDVVRNDLSFVLPHLADGATVAFHDVLNTSGQRVRVFAEQVLASDHFGPCGVCGSIGWARYRHDPAQAAPHRRQRLLLQRRLRPLVPFSGTGTPPRGLAKLRYRLLRSLVPHASIKPQAWLRAVA